MARDAPPLNWRQRIAELALGHTVNKLVLDWPFNYLLYPWVIYTLVFSMAAL